MSILYVRTSVDDFQSFSPFREIDITYQKNGIYQGGTCESIVWDFVYADADALRIHSVEQEIERGM